MTDAERRRLAAGAGLVSQARLVGGLLNMLVIVCLTRLLPKPEFAVVAFVYMVQETANALGPLGLPSAVSFFVPRLGPQVGRALGLQIGAILVLLAIPWALLLFFGGGLVAEWGQAPGAEGALGLVALSLLFDFPGQTLPGYLIAVEKFRGAFWVTLLFYLSRFASMVVPAWLGLDLLWIIGLFASVAILRGVAFLVYFVFIAEGDRGPGVRDQWRRRDLFNYGLPLALSQIVGKLNVQLDKYLIVTLCAAEVFAVYTVGAIELPLVPALAYSVTTALVPALVVSWRDGQKDAFVSLWHDSAVKVALVMMPVFVVAFVLAGPLMRVLFSADYDEATVPFRVYLCLLPMRLCGYGAVVRALGRTRPVLVASLAGLLANAALNYPFYQLFGLAGPAVASIAAQGVAIGLLLAVIRRELDLRWSTVMPWLRAAAPLGVAAVAAVPLALVLPWLPSDGVALAAGSAGYFAVYLVLGRMVGLLSAADLRYVLHFLTGRMNRRGT